MCGIAGLLQTRPTAENTASLTEKMIGALAHRGPDGQHVWTKDNMGLGHRRLAIVDLSPAGLQPMASATGRFVVTYNGEIYNHMALKAELEAENPLSWRGHSDTEVMLALFEKFSFDGALRRMNGMFAFALIDQQEKLLYLACDRFGEKPLYYGWAGSDFVFGSELKALKIHPQFPKDLNPEAIQAFTSYGAIPSPLSIYKNIKKLPPGHFLVLPLSVPPLTEPTARSYWSPLETIEKARATPSRLSLEDATEELDRRLHTAVGLRMAADVPLGAFLSGGVDSSLVVALMQAQSTAPVNTFSIGFSEPSYNEAPYAQAVAHHLKTDHHDLYMTGAHARDIVPRLPHIYDEPFADSSQLPTFFVAQLARQKVTVALSGDGGDEIFGGYNRYLQGSALYRKLSRIPNSVRAMAAWGAKTVPQGAWNVALSPFRHKGWNGSRVHKLASVLNDLTPGSLYDIFIRQCGMDIMSPSLFPKEPKNPLFRDDFTFVENMMLHDLNRYLPDDILAKVDRALMANSLEGRAPFLDADLLSFMWSLPLSYRIQNGEGKILLRRVLAKYVPDPLTNRPKKGFGVPLAQWLRNDLKEWADDLLSPESLSHGFFDVHAVRNHWQQHLVGTHDAHTCLWTVLMFQAWMKHERV